MYRPVQNILKKKKDLTASVFFFYINLLLLMGLKKQDLKWLPTPPPLGGRKEGI